jgi:nicotinamide-nucleotide amidase
MNCEIIAIGSEMLTPHRQDTNSLHVTAQLNELGVAVEFKTILGDNRRHIVDAIRIALARTDIVVIMGGLGPTEDDLTREATAEALGVGLHRDATLLTALYKRFAARRITMPENNTRQADVVHGADVLPNSRGTAPGQWLDTEYNGHRKLVMLLPGPPGELKPMFEEQCMPRLRDTIPLQHRAHRLLRMAMVPESEADARSAPIYKQYTDVETTILSHAGEIQLHFFCTKPTMEEARARVEELSGKVEIELEEFIFSTAGEPLEEIVLLLLNMRNLTLATAESCTGGMLAERLTRVSGSSRSYLGGAVVYSNALKTAFAGVPEKMIEQHGAVSEEVARELAAGIRKKTGASLGIAITGIAGPTGGTEEKPVGLVYLALCDGKKTQVVEKRFSGDRERVRNFATQQALDMVRRRLKTV